MDWSQISTWPNAEHSRQITGPAHRWHVQEAGDGPLILLLHGAGGSTHSMRDLFTLLAREHRVIALDLPGQGFTRLGSRNRCGLAHMTSDIAALAAAEQWQPTAITAHSAGAAIALSLSRQLLSPRGQPPHIIGINAALGEFEGLAGLLFPVMAKLLAAMPFSATLFSGAAAHPERVATLIASTGSHISPEGLALYRRLVSDTDHVRGTLQMMAQWNLKPLLKSLPDISAPVTLIAATNDKTVPAGTSADAAAKMPNARMVELPGLGHLAHEEEPGRVARIITETIHAPLDVI